MPKYLFHGSYSSEGLKGVLADGGSKRREAAKQAFSSLGGALESYYFGFGDDDYYAIADLPDNASAATASLVVSATGALTVKTTVLLTPEEVDAVTQKKVDYRPPGQ